MAKKPTQRTFRGDTKPKLIEQAIVALTRKYPIGVDDDGNEIYDEPCSPTSVELCDDYALVWFEYDPEYDDDVKYKFEYNHAVPLYHFWGRKRREKYLKEQKNA